jgi:hypothetical protein
VTSAATAEGRRRGASVSRHPVLDALRGTTPIEGVAGTRLTIQHLEQRDNALAALERATDELRRLEEVERGASMTEASPRIAAVREIAGEVGALRTRLDRTYV